MSIYNIVSPGPLKLTTTETKWILQFVKPTAFYRLNLKCSDDWILQDAINTQVNKQTDCDLIKKVSCDIPRQNSHIMIYSQYIGAPHVILKIYKVYPYTIYSRGRPYIFLELHGERL